MKRLAVISALAISLAARADEPSAIVFIEDSELPASLKPIFDAGELQREALTASCVQELIALESQIKEAKSQLKNAKTNRANYANREAQQADVELRTKQIADLEESANDKRQEAEYYKDRRFFIIPEIVETLNVGDVGTLPYGATATQVLSSNAAIAEVNVQRSPSSRGYCDQVTAMIVGVDLTNIADDDLFALRGVMEVTGTKTYKTVIGATKKVVAVSPHARASEIKEWSIKPRFHGRTWTSGKSAIVAEFVEFKGGKVTLRKKDFNKIEVDMTKLSKEDQEYVRAEVKLRTAKK